MPDKNGFDCLKMIRSHSRWSSLPVLMMTSDDSDKVLKQCFDAGANDFLSKPVQENTLLARLKSVLSVNSMLQDKSKEIIEVNQKLKNMLLTSEEASRCKSHFLATISHELRTPLNGVLAPLQILKEDFSTSEHRELLTLANRSGERLLKTLSSVIDYAQESNDGATVMISRSFNLDELLNSIFSIAIQRINSEVIDFHLTIDKELPKEFIGDDIRITQLVTTLIDNAIKFTERGHIHLSCRSLSRNDQSYLIELMVEDSGIGFDMRNYERLFEAFTQGDERLSRQYEGSGLGLAIAKNCAQKLGSNIEYKSQLHEGSAFWVNLKLKGTDAEVSTTSASTTKLSVTSFEHEPNVLVVEDNEDNILLMRTLLKKLKCRSSFAENGALALDLYPKDNWDLIFMDINMPIMDSLEATRRIRQVEANDRCFTPIVALTALTLAEDRIRCENAGMDDFLAKPIKIKELSSMLSKWCSSKDKSTKSTT